MATFVHGIASAQMIDSAGEVVDIKGLDVSSLDQTGMLNYEHLSNIPAQSVGKITKAKKIYTAEDCEDEGQLEFWNMIKVPFVYIIAELFDDYCESAREVAGKLKYSHDRPHQIGIYGFSIEGGSMPGAKEGVTIKRSLARKVAITDKPCNKACIAKLMPPQKSVVKDDFESIFKSEAATIEAFKTGEAMVKYEEYLAKSTTPPKPGSPNTHGMKTATPGIHLGNTQSGKPVFSNTHVHAYEGFSSQDHKDAAGLHSVQAQKYGQQNHKMADMHQQKSKLHNSAAETMYRKENRFARALAQHNNKMATVNKSLSAGGMDAAPSSLAGGAVYQKENLSKTKWSKRAKEEYDQWIHKSEFEKFMKANMPHLTKGEIEAIGRAVALHKSLSLEEALTKALKF